MADLFWPGDERARLAFDQGAFLETLVEVERAWFTALQRAGLAPEVDDAVLTGLATSSDVVEVAARAEAGGNPVVPLVALHAGATRRRATRPRPSGCTAA